MQESVDGLADQLWGWLNRGETLLKAWLAEEHISQQRDGRRRPRVVVLVRGLLQLPVLLQRQLRPGGRLLAKPVYRVPQSLLIGSLDREPRPLQQDGQVLRDDGENALEERLRFCFTSRLAGPFQFLRQREPGSQAVGLQGSRTAKMNQRFLRSTSQLFERCLEQGDCPARRCERGCLFERSRRFVCLPPAGGAPGPDWPNWRVPVARAWLLA